MIYVKSVNGNSDQALAEEINRLLYTEFRGKELVNVLFIGWGPNVTRIYQVIMKD